MMKYNMESLCSLVTSSSKSPDWEGGLCYKAKKIYKGENKSDND